VGSRPTRSHPHQRPPVLHHPTRTHRPQLGDLPYHAVAQRFHSPCVVPVRYHHLVVGQHPRQGPQRPPVGQPVLGCLHLGQLCRTEYCRKVRPGHEVRQELLPGCRIEQARLYRLQRPPRALFPRSLGMHPTRHRQLLAHQKPQRRPHPSQAPQRPPPRQHRTRSRWRSQVPQPPRQRQPPPHPQQPHQPEHQPPPGQCPDRFRPLHRKEHRLPRRPGPQEPLPPGRHLRVAQAPR
jgi:hypothetical protein